MPQVSSGQKLFFGFLTITQEQPDCTIMSAALCGEALKWQHYTTEHLKPPGHDNDNEACPEVSPLPVFVCLCLPRTPLVCSHSLSFSLSLSLGLSHTHTERQSIFISPLYAGSSRPAIAGLTPRCELCGGNVYSNPAEHAINLFLDRRQTRMSLHEGNKDGNTYPGSS